MLKAKRHYLARRETELLDILYRRGRATAVEILSECAGSRSYSTVRTQLRVLVQKGHVKRTVFHDGIWIQRFTDMRERIVVGIV